MSVITSRICDVCKIEYSDENYGWMILTAPNAPEDVVAEFDFCSYDCLVKWIEVDDEDEPENAEPTMTVVSTAPSPTPEAQARMDAAMKQVAAGPPMSLADAIASGKLDFTRGPQ